MIKRVNFTGRRRIPRDRIDIEVFAGPPRYFDASINVNDLDFPTDAAVAIEATCAGSSAVKRFDCGTVGNVIFPPKRALEGLTGENVFFCVKVIDHVELVGRILGVCENVRPTLSTPDSASGRQGLLPVERASLGHDLWKLDFKEHNVFLLVNEDVPELWDRARYDPYFYAVVYPAIVRCILERAIDENVDIEEDDDRWPVLWLQFGRALHPLRAFPPSPSDSREERDEWLDDVVSSFCREHSLKSRYQSTQAID
jgi:hypothetical protein